MSNVFNVPGGTVSDKDTENPNAIVLDEDSQRRLRLGADGNPTGGQSSSPPPSQFGDQSHIIPYDPASGGIAPSQQIPGLPDKFGGDVNKLIAAHAELERRLHGGPAPPAGLTDPSAPPQLPPGTEQVAPGQTPAAPAGAPVDPADPNSLKLDAPDPNAPPPQGVEVMNKWNEVYAATGTIPQEGMAELQAAGYPPEVVQTHMAGMQALARERSATLISEVGDPAQFQAMLQWANQNLDANASAAFNASVDSHNAANPALAMAQARMAVRGLAAQWRAATGGMQTQLEGHVSTAPTGPQVLPYGSMAEQVADQSSPQYANDPAFRKHVENRIRAGMTR